MLGSLGVNVVLLAVLLWPVMRDRASVNRFNRLGTASGAKPMPSKSPKSAAGKKAAVQPVPSVWSQLESADFRQFAANLRRAGCPEATLCDVLRPAIIRSFDERRRLPATPGDHYWATGAARRALRAHADSVEAALNDEQDRLLAELVCPENLLDKDNGFDVLLIVEVVSGFLPRPSQQGVLHLIMDVQRVQDRWRQRTQGILLPEEVAALERQEVALQQRLDQLLPAADREELELRMWFVIKGDGSSAEERRARLRLSAAELREFARIMVGTEISPLNQLLEFNRILDPPAPRLTKAEAEVQMRALLGEERFALHQRDNDNAYQYAESLTGQHHLAPEVAGQAYELMTAFRAELAPLRAAWANDRALARQALLEQRTQMRARLEALLVGVPEPARHEALNGWVDQAIKEIWHSP